MNGYTSKYPINFPSKYKITQKDFDDCVYKYMSKFDLTYEKDAAIMLSIREFEGQGLDLSHIVTGMLKILRITIFSPRLRVNIF